ncbi:hypothetical protein LEMLEM_LOCUS4201, partial [Lemmus lemmus]
MSTSTGFVSQRKDTCLIAQGKRYDDTRPTHRMRILYVFYSVPTGS